MGWFIFVLGILIGIVVSKLWDLKAKTAFPFKWWHYAVGVILLMWTAYGSIFAYDSFMEGETRAGWFFIMVHGGLAIIVSFLLIGIERRRSVRLPAQRAGV